MTTTYEHGSWTVGGTSPLDYIIAALGDYANEYELTNVTIDFVLKIQESLPNHVYLCGSQLYSTKREKDYDLTEIVEAIDLAKIYNKYALLDTWHVNEITRTETLHQYVMECLGQYHAEYRLGYVEQELEDEINLLLPDGYVLRDNKIYGPAGSKAPDLEAILNKIDFWEMAEPHSMIVKSEKPQAPKE
jgi:hypothetical protein